MRDARAFLSGWEFAREDGKAGGLKKLTIDNYQLTIANC
jgi:hypothetical protein